MRLLLVGLNCTLHTLALLSMQATALSSAMLQSLTVPSSLPLRNLVGSVYSSNGQQLTYMMQVRAQEVGNSSGQGPLALSRLECNWCNSCCTDTGSATGCRSGAA